MSDTVIKVENLGKKYIIGHQKEESYTALRDVITNGVKSIFQPNSLKKDAREEFWALKDVSFEIKQGDRVGIIGRNGAGKSTLLKILSRITEPTEGRIKIKGRVASLLEVGTGFHPELTGRENIYLNGAILGMGKAEIKRKFDEIVAFAEVEKFLDTPVKRYSSGMYVRLAFAVAAHLEPEILVVDEVLAVGDAQFQKKCLGKMEDVGKEGRTVLFVSHNIGAIRNLCNRGILLQQGCLISNAKINIAIESYFESTHSQSNTVYLSNDNEKSEPYFKKIVCFQDIDLLSNHNSFDIEKPIYVDFFIERFNTNNLVVALSVFNSSGILVHHSTDELLENFAIPTDKRTCIIPSHGLAPGKYHLTASLSRRNIKIFEKKDYILGFKVELNGHIAKITNSSDWKGVCGPGILEWSSPN